MSECPPGECPGLEVFAGRRVDRLDVDEVTPDALEVVHRLTARPVKGPPRIVLVVAHLRVPGDRRERQRKVVDAAPEDRDPLSLLGVGRQDVRILDDDGRSFLGGFYRPLPAEFPRIVAAVRAIAIATRGVRGSVGRVDPTTGTVPALVRTRETAPAMAHAGVFAASTNGSL